MKLLFILLCFCFSQLCNAEYEVFSAKNGVVYGLVTLEYQPMISPNFQDVDKMKKTNFDSLKNFVPVNSSTSTVGYNFIMLFNEYAISSIEVRRDRKLAMKFAQEIPETGINPCETFDVLNSTQDLTLKFSCLSRSHQMYLVANLIELVPDNSSQNPYLYSTTVAFDRRGTVVARYRKSHLYDESGLSAADPEVVTFTTDFGVTFGLLTSLDIMFEYPAMDLINSEATEVLIPYSWSGVPPFLTPLQMQYGWHLSVNTMQDTNNFFSCYSKPSLGYTGCGRYFSNNQGYIFTISSGDCCDTCTCGVSVNSNVTANSINKLKNDTKLLEFTNQYDLSNFTSSLLTKTTELIKQQICNNGLCCNLEYQFANVTSDSNYQFIVFSGLMYAPDREKAWNIQTCGLVACLDESIESCSSLSAPYAVNTVFDTLTIDGVFQTSLVLPSVLNSQLIPISKLDFNKTIIDSSNYKIELNYTGDSLNSVQVFALHSHNVDFFTFPGEPSAAISFTNNSSLLFLILTAFIYQVFS